MVRNRIGYRILWIIGLCLIHSALLSQASNNEVAFRHLSVKDGLSQNGVMSILKDSRDFMWFGTRDGLNLYDGIQFRTFRHNNKNPYSLSNNYIRTIVEDRTGTIWIGTEDGLNAYDSHSGSFIVYKNLSEDNNSLSNNKVSSILPTSNGDLWIGTENGLNLKRKGSSSFIRYYHSANDLRSLCDSQITSLFEDSAGNIWIGTASGGLNKLVKGVKGFDRFYNSADSPNNPRFNRINCIAEDKEGFIWIGTSNGLDIVSKKGGYKVGKDYDKLLSNTLIRSLVFDKHGNLWVGTFDGLNYLNTSTGEIKVYKNTNGKLESISHNSIRSLYLDQNGFLWVGTYFGGINILDPTTSQFIHYRHSHLDPKSLGYDVVSSMVENKENNIWVGTEGGGLYYFDYRQKHFSKITEFNGKPIHTKTIKSILLDSKGNLWIGTHLNGLRMINLESGKIREFYFQTNNSNSIRDNSVISLLEDWTGKIWIGTMSGLNLFDPDQDQMLRLDFLGEDISGNNAITSLFEDSNRTVWIGTKKKGIIRYADGVAQRYVHNVSDSSSISHNSIYCIYEDNNNKLWFGTYGGGLNQMDPKRPGFKKFGVAEGLVNDIVYSIMEDSECNLWISTPGGISRFDPESQLFRNFTPDKGLPIEEFNEHSSLLHSDGSIFMGGFNGLLAFQPWEIENNSIIPNLVFRELKVFNKKIVPNDGSEILEKSLNNSNHIEFSHHDNVFTLEYSAFSYPHLGSNRYAYMLEGFEDDWNYVGDQTSATYTNLDPGNYTFKVKVANGDGIWNPNIRSLSIKKLPPFWRTIWAYILYVSFFTMVFYFIRRYLLIKLRLENKLKLAKLEKKEIKKLTRLKLNFFTNISHDFRTPLTLISGPLQELMDKSLNTPAHGQLLLIKRNVNLMQRLIDQLLDFRKLEKEKISLKLINEPYSEFVKEITFSFQELAKNLHIDFSFTCRFGNKKIWYDKAKLEKVLYNLLSNAFKYTPKKGTITVEVVAGNGKNSTMNASEPYEYVEVIVRNSGPGIDMQDLDRVFDRFYQGANQSEYNQPGTGIGLSLAKNLIELHKGYINVNCRPNEFTEFKFGIPTNDIYQDRDKLPTWASNRIIGKEEDFASTPISKKENHHSILIVEDNYDLCNFLEQIFEREYSVRKAKNGEDALDRIREVQPSLIISDIMMPKMSGIELSKKLKADPKLSHIPILLLTARSSKAIELDSYGIGVEDFISKPFDVKVLKSKVRNLIRSREKIKARSRKEVLMSEEMIDNNSSDDKFLNKLSDYIRDNLEDPNLNVAKTSMDLGISRVHLYRKVKAITGKTPVLFIRDFRLAVAEKLLEQDSHNVNEICYRVGFQDVSYFRKCFKDKFGVTASKYAYRSKMEQIN